MRSSQTEVDLPYNFKSDKAEKLSISAFDLRKAHYLDQAIKLYRQAIQIEDNPRLFFDLAECYARKDELQQAILCMDSAIILDPSNPVFYDNRGWYCYQHREDEKAIADYRKSIQLDSNSFIPYENLSIVYYADDKMEDACEAFRRAMLLGMVVNNLEDQKELSALKQLCQ